MWGEPGRNQQVFALRRISTHSPRVGRTKWRSGSAGSSLNFNSLAPCGANPCRKVQRLFWQSHFNSLAPCGANHGKRKPCEYFANFNSLAPCGANLHLPQGIKILSIFQLTRPVWGEPQQQFADLCGLSFQLTRPVWGEPAVRPRRRRDVAISTHSPRVGRTLRGGGSFYARARISTHSPRVGRTSPKMLSITRMPSISTHSPRVGRTISSVSFSSDIKYFNSLAPCGANPLHRRLQAFYIRFQLTRPVWGEPKRCDMIYIELYISTHSPRVGRTDRARHVVNVIAHFNSLAPCGANLRLLRLSKPRMIFQLTRPVWGEPSEVAVGNFNE